MTIKIGINVSIKAENGKMIDGEIDLGEFDFLLNI